MVYFEIIMEEGNNHGHWTISHTFTWLAKAKENDNLSATLTAFFFADFKELIKVEISYLSWDDLRLIMEEITLDRCTSDKLSTIIPGRSQDKVCNNLILLRNPLCHFQLTVIVFIKTFSFTKISKYFCFRKSSCRRAIKSKLLKFWIGGFLCNLMEFLLWNLVFHKHEFIMGFLKTKLKLSFSGNFYIEIML